MKMYKAIIVEDQEAAAKLLINKLADNHQDIEIIGHAKSVIEASKLLSKTKPDILFLDIMLGDGTGFDILEIHPNLNAKIIFVTASDAYALKAFKFSAIDYILKPYSDSDLVSAINKIKTQANPNKEQLSVLQNTINQPNKRPNKISLHTSDKIIVVSLNEIVRCKSDNNYTEFFLADGQKILVSKTLKFYADMLKEFQFLRVHQSHLVNVLYIKEFIKSDGGYLMLNSKETVPVSVRKRNEVIEALNTL